MAQGGFTSSLHTRIGRSLSNTKMIHIPNSFHVLKENLLAVRPTYRIQVLTQCFGFDAHSRSPAFWFGWLRSFALFAFGRHIQNISKFCRVSHMA